MKKARKVKNYINNKTLFEAIIEYKQKVNAAGAAGKKIPEIPMYIGQAIILLCNNLSKRPNFYSYTFREEMISDGIIDCIAAVGNFKQEKTNNPFGYFTQIAWYAFLRRIAKEKKETYIKHKNFQNSFLMDELYQDRHDFQLKSNEFSDEVIQSFEDKLLTKAKKNSIIKSGVEVFVEEDNENDE